ncbi:MAG: ABC transporter ATP-binding protein, partial [Actinomycetota bacterium]
MAREYLASSPVGDPQFFGIVAFTQGEDPIEPLLMCSGLRVAVSDRDSADRFDLTPPVSDRGEHLEQGWVEVIDGVDLSVFPSERVAIVGESASGKSLIVNGMFALMSAGTRTIGGKTTFAGSSFNPGGEETVDTGGGAGFSSLEDRLAGTQLAEGSPEWMRTVGTQVGFVFQDPTASWNPLMYLGGQSGEALGEHNDLSNEEIELRVLDALGDVQLPKSRRFFRSTRRQFSAGQNQRAMLAEALTRVPDLLVADEPFAGLDVSVAATIIELLHDLQRKRGMALLVVTHDFGLVARIADRVVMVYAGQVVEIRSAIELFRSPRHPYTAGLLASVPGLTDRRLEALRGEA